MFNLSVCFLSFWLIANFQFTREAKLSAQSFPLANAKKRISKEKAIEVALAKFKEDREQISKHKIFAFERQNFWNVLFELDKAEDNIIEYVLRKSDGTFIRVNIFSQDSSQFARSSQPLTKSEIISRLTTNASTHYEISNYDIALCELSHSWRVVYDLKLEGAVLSGGPQYLVNKYNGEFISKIYFH